MLPTASICTTASRQFLISMFKIGSPKVLYTFCLITLPVFLAFLGRFAATFCKLLGFSNLINPFIDPDSFGAHFGMLGMASLASTDWKKSTALN